MSSNVRSFFQSHFVQRQALNTSCCGTDAKKKTVKKTSNPKLNEVIQQRATPNITIDDNLTDLFGKKDVTKALIQQLVQRTLTAPMNSTNDDPPRLCTKKHVSKFSVHTNKIYADLFEFLSVCLLMNH